MKQYCLNIDNIFTQSIGEKLIWFLQQQNKKTQIKKKKQTKQQQQQQQNPQKIYIFIEGKLITPMKKGLVAFF